MKTQDSVDSTPTLGDVTDAVRVGVAGHDEGARVRLQDRDAVVADAAEELGRLVERPERPHGPLLAPDDAPEAAPAEHVRPPAPLLLLLALALALALVTGPLAAAAAELVPAPLLLLPAALLHAPGALVPGPVLAPPHAAPGLAVVVPGRRGDGGGAEEGGEEDEEEMSRAGSGGRHWGGRVAVVSPISCRPCASFDACLAMQRRSW